MSNLVPIESFDNLPAHLRAFTSDANEFGFSGGSFPSLSIKGKVFTIIRNGEKALVTKPDSDGEPATSLEVVILGVGPKGGTYAKTFYAEGFVEGTAAKPTCYSNDGVSPAGDAQTKQSSKCALCPQNAKGSGATAQNANAKACRSSKMLAIAPAGQLNDPMLLRVPGDSLIALGEYGDFLAKRRLSSAAVVTRIGFDYTVSHPKLTFKAIGGITPQMAGEVAEQRESTLVKVIIGEKAFSEIGGEDFSTPKAVAAPVAKPEPTPASEPAPAPAPAPAAKPAKKPAPAVPVAEDAPGGIDAALDSINFDD